MKSSLLFVDFWTIGVSGSSCMFCWLVFETLLTSDYFEFVLTEITFLSCIKSFWASWAILAGFFSLLTAKGIIKVNITREKCIFSITYLPLLEVVCRPLRRIAWPIHPLLVVLSVIWYSLSSSLCRLFLKTVLLLNNLSLHLLRNSITNNMLTNLKASLSSILSYIPLLFLTSNCFLQNF